MKLPLKENEFVRLKVQVFCKLYNLCTTYAKVANPKLAKTFFCVITQVIVVVNNPFRKILELLNSNYIIKSDFYNLNK